MKTMKMLRNLAALAAALLLALTLCVPAFGETPSWGDLAMDVAVAQRAERGIADNQPLLTEDAFPAGSSVSDWTGPGHGPRRYRRRLRRVSGPAAGLRGAAVCGERRPSRREGHGVPPHRPDCGSAGGRPRSFRRQARRNGHRSGGGGHLQLARRGGLGRTGPQRLDLRPTDHGRGRRGGAADARYSRQDMLDAIVSAQLPDGGFSLGGGAMDVDITAMALQALAPYQQQYRRSSTRR